MAETEAPATRRKPPETATPSAYSHRARRRLYPIGVGRAGAEASNLRARQRLLSIDNLRARFDVGLDLHFSPPSGAIAPASRDDLRSPLSTFGVILSRVRDIHG